MSKAVKNFDKCDEEKGSLDKEGVFEVRFFDPRNDVAFKKVFVQHEGLTHSFLNSTLRLTGDRQIKSVEFIPTERLAPDRRVKKIDP